MRIKVSKVSGLVVAGVAFVFLGAASVQAQSDVLGLSCKGYATITADTATKEIFQRAGAFETNQPGKVLVIAAGRKFFVPARQVDADTLAPLSAYDRMRAWNEAYADAYHHCIYANNITIEVKR